MAWFYVVFFWVFFAELNILYMGENTGVVIKGDCNRFCNHQLQKEPK